jgi:hypothetical protein
MTPSRRAVSIVFPNYGRWAGPWPRMLGIHEYIGDYWHLLPSADAASRAMFAADGDIEFFDLR